MSITIANIHSSSLSRSKGSQKPSQAPSRESFFESSLRPKLQLPKTLKPRMFLDQTLIYTYQPPMPFGSSRSKQNEYLIREGLVEKLSREKEGKKQMLLASLNIPLEGRLVRNRKGGYDLKVSPLLKSLFYKEGIPAEESVIPVILPHEHPIMPVCELGEVFRFKLTGYYSCQPQGWPGMHRVWFLLIESEELEIFRERYRLPLKPQGHPFHLLISREPSSLPKLDRSYYRINTALQFA